MNKLLEVREFEKISCNPDFKTEYAYLPESVFRDLEEFIHAFAGDEEYADALEFLKISFRRNVGDIISVNNYVGLIQMQNGPKFQEHLRLFITLQLIQVMQIKKMLFSALELQIKLEM